MGSDYYVVLGLTEDATPEEIRSAYFTAARRLHPDANPDQSSSDLFLKIQEAYDVLSNPKRRSEYDATLGSAILVKPAISTHVRTSRSELPRLNEPQVIYALIDLACTAEIRKADLPAVHLCLVIDRSTSMNGSRMDMVKANIVQAVKFLKPQDVISVVSFSDRAEVAIPPTQVSSFSKVENRLYAIHPSGGTEIYQGLLAGLTLLRDGPDGTALRQLILLTDGQTYGDEAACLSLAKQASLEGVSISALGIGNEWNDRFLDQLTSLSGGSTTLITQTKDLARYLEQKVKILDAAYAREITLDFKSDPGVELTYVFRLSPEVTPLPAASPISLASLPFAKSLSLLLEFTIQPQPEDVDTLQILDGRLKMQVNEQGGKRARLFINIKRPVRSNPDPEPPPTAIVDALSRLTLYRMQEKARHEVDSGNLDQAARHLQYLATHLLSRGNQELAHTVLVEAEHIRQNHTFSKDGDKNIKYGTRALMLPPGLESRP